MAKEIERRFLVENLPNEIKEKCVKSNIIQAYISSKPTTRVRLMDNKAYITIKGKKINLSADEYEYEIPFEDAKEIISLCSYKVEKIRYYYFSGSISDVWEVDVFKGENEGLIIAEREMKSEKEEIIIPDFCKKDVSDDFRYSNSNLAINPYKRWK